MFLTPEKKEKKMLKVGTKVKVLNAGYLVTGKIGTVVDPKRDAHSLLDANINRVEVDGFPSPYRDSKLWTFYDDDLEVVSSATDQPCAKSARCSEFSAADPDKFRAGDRVQGKITQRFATVIGKSNKLTGCYDVRFDSDNFTVTVRESDIRLLSAAISKPTFKVGQRVLNNKKDVGFFSDRAAGLIVGNVHGSADRYSVVFQQGTYTREASELLPYPGDDKVYLPDNFFEAPRVWKVGDRVTWGDRCDDGTIVEIRDSIAGIRMDDPTFGDCWHDLTILVPAKNPNPPAPKFKVGMKVNYKTLGGKTCSGMVYHVDSLVHVVWDDGRKVGHSKTDSRLSIVK